MISFSCNKRLIGYNIFIQNIEVKNDLIQYCQDILVFFSTMWTDTHPKHTPCESNKHLARIWVYKGINVPLVLELYPFFHIDFQTKNFCILIFKSCCLNRIDPFIFKHVKIYTWHVMLSTYLNITYLESYVDNS